MPFYALGVNLAKQVGGQTGFNSLLDEDELEIVLSGFSDSIRGQTTQDPDASEYLFIVNHVLYAPHNIIKCVDTYISKITSLLLMKFYKLMAWH